MPGTDPDRHLQLRPEQVLVSARPQNASQSCSTRWVSRCELFEPEPRRTSVVAHWEPDGVDTSLSPLLIHGHLDVVPAKADDWSVPPFSGEVVDGCIWGRGAVDMKDFDAMVLSVVRARARAGAAPRRPIRLIFTADEEAGSGLGARWLVDEHPEVVDGCKEAIGEVGGFSLTVRDDLRLYLIQTAEKGMAWLDLIADGRAGHGSFRNDENAITELSAAVARIGEYEWPRKITDAAAGVPGGGLRGVRSRA